jgi:hypothetical protein
LGGGETNMNTSLTVLKTSLNETYPGELMAQFDDMKPHPIYPDIHYGLYVDICSYQNKKFVVYGYAERADRFEQFNIEELTNTFEEALEVAEKYITEAKQFLKYKPTFEEYLNKKTYYKFYDEQINKLANELLNLSKDDPQWKVKKLIYQDYKDKIKNIIVDTLYEYELIIKGDKIYE